MASRPDFVAFVAEQLRGEGTITCRPMFGDYGVYCDGKIFALICDDQLFVKITAAGEQMAPGLPKAPPYDGAKPYFLIEDVEDRDFLTRLTRVTCEALPAPKPKKAKT